FFRFLRPVVDKGYLYIAQPPLYRYKKGKQERYLKDDTALSNFLIEHGVENFDFEGLGKNDLIDLFKTVSRYRGMLNQLEKRYSLIEVLKHLIENSDLVKLEQAELYEEVKNFLENKGYNILSKNINEERIQLFVQTNEGLEELIIDDELFASPYFSEATYIYNKLVERDISMFDGRDLVEVLEEIEGLAKKGAYIQRYKGLGEMNPEQLWETTMTPEDRRLLRVTVEDAEIASDTFTLFMGDEVEPRRNYIEEHAKDVEHLDV
ncbi:MAG: DNA gyrase subunit B, partial [Campylobacterales bacterium]|nr:DNA gyrase subunit B [Campylobacterales bacterium]